MSILSGGLFPGTSANASPDCAAFSRQHRSFTGFSVLSPDGATQRKTRSGEVVPRAKTGKTVGSRATDR